MISMNASKGGMENQHIYAKIGEKRVKNTERNADILVRETYSTLSHLCNRHGTIIMNLSRNSIKLSRESTYIDYLVAWLKLKQYSYY